MRQHVTIKEVAKQAGVSVTTVSRYLNGRYERMSAVTKEKVAATIKKLNYAPAASARRMRQDQSHLVGLLVGDVGNPFSTMLAKGVYDVLQPAGYDVLLMNTDDSTATEARALNRLYAQQVDGIIVQPSAKDFAQYQPAIDAGIPLVVVDREVPNQPLAVGKVTSPNLTACYDLGCQLAARGYQNIISVSAQYAEASGQIPRMAGLKAAANQTGINYLNLATQKGTDQETLADQLQKWVTSLRGKTVIVSLMGPVLFDLLAIFQDLNWHFPQDVGLVSYDDWAWSRFVGDGICLVKQDMETMGNLAAQNLLKQIAAGTTHSATSLVPVEFIDAPSI